PQTDRSGPVLGRGPTPSKPRTGSMKAPSDAAGPSAVSASLRGDGGQGAAYDHHPVEPRQRIEVGDVAAAQVGKLKPGETRVALHLRLPRVERQKPVALARGEARTLAEMPLDHGDGAVGHHRRRRRKLRLGQMQARGEE